MRILPSMGFSLRKKLMLGSVNPDEEIFDWNIPVTGFSSRIMVPASMGEWL